MVVVAVVPPLPVKPSCTNGWPRPAGEANGGVGGDLSDGASDWHKSTTIGGRRDRWLIGPRILGQAAETAKLTCIGEAYRSLG